MAYDIAGAVRLYADGATLRQVGKFLGCRARTAGNLLRVAGVAVRPAHYPKWSPGRVKRRKYNADDDYFLRRPITDEAAYLFGLFAGDGCVHRPKRVGDRGRYVVSLAMQRKDADHLETVKRLLRYDGPTRNYPASKGGKNLFAVIVHSNGLADGLIRMGVTERKSLTFVAPDEMADNRHWWRGLVDADGCINRLHGEANGVTLVAASRPLIDQYRAFVSQLIPQSRAKVHESHRNVSPLYYATFSHRNAARILAHLYQPGDLALPRKAALARQLAERFP